MTRLNQHLVNSQLGISLAILRFSISDQLFVRPYGHVGLEFKLRPFSAGSILTLRNKIEPLASTTSVERTPAENTINKTHAVNHCAGETGDPHHPGTGVASDISRL